jgi:hypothetical protein
MTTSTSHDTAPAHDATAVGSQAPSISLAGDNERGESASDTSLDSSSAAAKDGKKDAAGGAFVDAAGVPVKTEGAQIGERDYDIDIDEKAAAKFNKLSWPRLSVCLIVEAIVGIISAEQRGRA